MQRFSLLTFICLFAIIETTQAQFGTNTNQLERKFDVGFIRQVVYDYTRSGRERINFLLNDFNSKQTDRLPITLHIWYPSVQKEDHASKRLPYVDFQLMQDYDIDTLTVDERDLLRKDYFSWADSAYVQKMIDSITTNAIYKATPLKGKYPLVLSFSTNPGMNEYLASLGYVVVRIHYSYSDRTASVTNKNREMNEDVATVHFVKNYITSNFNTADTDRTALIGFSYYGSIMQLVQMSSSVYRAIVSLDGVEAWANARDRITRNDHFLPEMAFSPILRIHNQNAPNIDWDYFYKKAVNCDQWVISFDKITHGNTTNPDLSIEIEKITTGQTNKTLKAKQELMWHSIGHFLNRYIKNDHEGEKFLIELLSKKMEETSVTFKQKASVKIPSAQEMKMVFEATGLNGLKEMQVQMNDSAHLLSVLVLYNLAQLYRFTDPAKQLELMNFAMSLYPQSLFAKYIVALYHSQAGRFEQAISLAKRALQMANSNTQSDLNSRQLDQLKTWLLDWEERIKRQNTTNKE